jgi:hypothetical protein
MSDKYQFGNLVPSGATKYEARLGESKDNKSQFCNSNNDFELVPACVIF